MTGDIRTCSPPEEEYAPYAVPPYEVDLLQAVGPETEI
jgi:hypothetical protein